MSTLREHLASFTPDMSGRLEGLAADAIAYANGGHWATLLTVPIPELDSSITVTVASLIETLQLGDFLADKLDPWAEL